MDEQKDNGTVFQLEYLSVACLVECSVFGAAVKLVLRLVALTVESSVISWADTSVALMAAWLVVSLGRKSVLSMVAT